MVEAGAYEFADTAKFLSAGEWQLIPYNWPYPAYNLDIVLASMALLQNL